jgi:hypothetical protein
VGTAAQYTHFCLGIVKIIIVCPWKDLNVQLREYSGQIAAFNFSLAADDRNPAIS